MEHSRAMVKHKWELQNVRTDTQTPLLCPVLERVAGCALWCCRFCGLAGAQLAQRGTSGTHNTFYRAELIGCHALVPAVPRKPGIVVGGEAKGAMVGGKGKEKGVRPGALTSIAPFISETDAQT